MDATNTKCRIRQCSKCPGILEYFCVTCSSDLCLECTMLHMITNLNKNMCNVVIYREKSNYLQKHEICMRHPNNVYTKYCEPCRIPICTDCTDHRNHIQTVETVDVETAYETKRKNREIVKNIQWRALPICYGLLLSRVIDLISVYSNKANLKLKILRNSEKLMDCLDYVLHNFHLEHRCFKQKIKVSKYITNTYMYERLYEHSSDAPIKFLLSVKKHQSTKSFKNHGQITLTTCKSLKTETIIEKLLTINFTNKGESLEKLLEQILRTPQPMSFCEGPMLFYLHILLDLWKRLKDPICKL